MADMTVTPVPKPKENHAVPVRRDTVRAIADYAGTTVEAVLERLAGVFTADLLKSIADELKAEQVATATKALHAALGEHVSGSGLNREGGIPIVGSGEVAV